MKKEKIKKVKPIKPIPYKAIDKKELKALCEGLTMDNMLVKLVWQKERFTNLDLPGNNAIIKQEIIGCGPGVIDFKVGDIVKLANPFNMMSHMRDGFNDVVSCKFMNILSKISK